MGITAEKGRLSEEEIERMIREAEEFAEEDARVKDRIDGRNGLEGYLYNLKNLLDDEKGVADKISEEEAEEISEAIDDALEWLEDNQELEKEDYEDKQKEVEKLVNPVMEKLYQGGAPARAATITMTRMTMISTTMSSKRR